MFRLNCLHRQIFKAGGLAKAHIAYLRVHLAKIWAFFKGSMFKHTDFHMSCSHDGGSLHGYCKFLTAVFRHADRLVAADGPGPGRMTSKVRSLFKEVSSTVGLFTMPEVKSRENDFNSRRRVDKGYYYGHELPWYKYGPR